MGLPQRPSAAEIAAGTGANKRQWTPADIKAMIDAHGGGGGGGGGPDELIIKSVDEAVNNNDTLQNDDELFFSVAEGDRWHIQSVIYYSSPAGVKITYDLDSGNPAVSRYTNTDIVGFDELRVVHDFGVVFDLPGSPSGIKAARATITLDNTGGDATTFRLKWAQQINNPLISEVHQGSTLIAWKV